MSCEAVRELESMGIEVCMSSGDKAASARELQKKKKKVATAGDGINDSAALAAADLGIALGKGSNLDAAKVAIVSSDLRMIPELIKLSKQTSRTINVNLFLAFIYNIVAIPMAAGLFGFHMNPDIAAACMALGSLCVVWNSLRLRK